MVEGGDESRAGRSLAQRLASGSVICAEGYLFELERRGYLQAGAFVPEIALDHPEVVAQLHRDFLHAGSDVVVALTYYAHREKLRALDREDMLERLNREALAIAREVATADGALLAGNISNTNLFAPGDRETRRQVTGMFAEQLGWAAEASVDYVIGETFSWAEEALIALEVSRELSLPAVITLAVHRHPETREGWPVAEACRRLADAGADVVGLNCARGPRTMLPLLAEVVQAVDVPVAGLPVPYRTHEGAPSFQSLRDPGYDRLPADRPFPTALDPFTCNRYEIADFAKEASALGVSYLGLCCGAGPHHVRSMVEALGRSSPASRYSADMSRHAFLGASDTVRTDNRDFASDY